MERPTISFAAHHDTAGAFGRKIFLSYVYAVEARGQAEVGAIIHDQRDSREQAAQLPRLRQRLAGIQPLGAILQKGAASLGQCHGMRADRLQQLSCFASGAQAVRVEDGIEDWNLHTGRQKFRSRQ